MIVSNKFVPGWGSVFLVFLIGLLFSQIWFDIGGFTIRVEDVFVLFSLFLVALPVVLLLRFRMRKSYFHAPLLLLGLVILMGVVVSLLRPYPAELQKDSVVNGLRLLLAISIYFIVLRLPFPASTLTKTMFYAVIMVSFVTTAVSLLQIAYWEKWLPISLPTLLIELKEEANQAQGREIFALFIGDTGTHVWSAMLAFQAVVVWVLAISSRNFLYKVSWFTYFSILFFIVVRTSVRNSLFGLIVAIAVIILLRTWRSRYPLNHLLKPYLLITLGIVLLVGLFSIAPDTYYVERIRQAIPQFEAGKLVILPGSNIYGRLDGARAALLIFRTFPITGGGFGSYALLSVSIADVHKLAHAHNSFLHFLAELGLAGFIAIVWLVWRVIVFLVFSGRHLQGDDKWRARLWYLTVGCMVFMMTTAMFANPYGQPKEVMFCLMLLALLVKYSRQTEEEV